MSNARKRPSAKELVSILEASLRVLKAARADINVINQFTLLIEFVKKDGARVIFGDERLHRDAELSFQFNDDLRTLTIEDVERLLERDDLPRKFFEKLAAERFGVPKGSMRQWSNRASLLDKIATMMQNERTHRTISEVARREQDIK